MDKQPQAVTHLKVVRGHPLPGAASANVAYLDDAAFLRALRARDASATAALFDAHQEMVLKVLARVLGIDTELRDLLQDVFVRALRGVDTVRDARLLAPWLRQIAVCTAMDCLRRRRRRRWLSFVTPDELDQAIAPAVDSDAREAMRRVYRILQQLPDAERVAFTLRTLLGMELTETAAACQCSLATVKRRLSRAEQRFMSAAVDDAVLSAWLKQGNGCRVP